MLVRTLSQAKAELSALVESVEEGALRPRTPGSMSGEIWIAPDFDTLPEDVTDAFGVSEPRK